MTDKFRVALSGDFRKADGSPTYPDFDLAPLHAAQGIEVVFLRSANPLRADQLEDIDALILLAHRFAAESVPKSGRLAVVARFGVGYDTVDVDACTQAGIALVITPDGDRQQGTSRARRTFVQVARRLKRPTWPSALGTGGQGVKPVVPAGNSNGRRSDHGQS
jgi:hypothetical protein